MEFQILVAGLTSRDDELFHTVKLNVDMSTNSSPVITLYHSALEWKWVTSFPLPEALPSLAPSELRGSLDVFHPVR